MGWFSKKQSEQQIGFDIDSILRLANYTEAEIEIDNQLNKKSEFGDELDKLNDPEKNFLFVENLLREVNNGGFNQWFYNSSGDYAHETIAALNAIGAVKMAAFVEKAISIWPERNVPKDKLVRQDMLQQMEDSAKPEWEKLDNMFYQGEDNLDNYGELLIEYVKKNKQNFK